jgi:Ni2+-binding GTPase involved in maturation of urease and hydrogenase
VIVNDMSELNIDASTVKNSRLVQAEEKMVEMHNGCICCTLREDLLHQVANLAREGKYDYLVIESTGISEPMQVAETFAFEADTGEAVAAADGARSLHDIARLDTCVTVVDASNLWSQLASIESLKDRQSRGGEGGGDEEEDRNVADLLIDQVEFADVILLNKVDLVSAEEQKRMIAFLKRLNPEARILPSCRSQVDLSQVRRERRTRYVFTYTIPSFILSFFLCLVLLCFHFFFLQELESNSHSSAISFAKTAPFPLLPTPRPSHPRSSTPASSAWTRRKSPRDGSRCYRGTSRPRPSSTASGPLSTARGNPSTPSGSTRF